MKSWNSMAKAPDHYQILGLEELQKDSVIASERLRQAYKQALLYFHPDKQNASRTRHQGPVPSIDEISEAYRVLADPRSRSQYDQTLEAQNADEKGETRHTGMEIVDLEELDFDQDSSKWIRSCRCGSEPAFVVTESELENNADYGELITGCKGCSLWLKVLFTVEE